MKVYVYKPHIIGTPRELVPRELPGQFYWSMLFIKRKIQRMIIFTKTKPDDECSCEEFIKSHKTARNLHYTPKYILVALQYCTFLHEKENKTIQSLSFIRFEDKGT